MHPDRPGPIFCCAATLAGLQSSQMASRILLSALALLCAFALASANVPLPEGAWRTEFRFFLYPIALSVDIAAALSVILGMQSACSSD